MALPSQVLKKHIYPDDFSEDDKLEFDRLDVESKLYHADIYKKDKWLIHLAIIGYIRKQRNGGDDDVILKEDELAEMKAKYKLKSRVFETDVPEFLQDKNHEIYKEITVQE
jgi:hypothetical protein